MDNVIYRTPTKAAGIRAEAAATPSPGRRGLLTGAASPSVRRRPPSPTADVERAGSPSPSTTPPPPPPPPLPPPSEATEQRVMRLQDSVASVVGRHLLLPPVYTAPGLSAGRPITGARRVAECPRLRDDFWSHVGRQPTGSRSEAPQMAPLTEEHRSKLLYAVTSLETRLSSGGYPSAEVLRHLLRCCMEGDREVRRRCLRVLRRVAYLHPPHGRQMRRLYRSVLATLDSDWQPLWTAVKRCLPSADDDPVTQEDHLLNTELLDLLVWLLEEDISHWRRTNTGLRPSTRLQDSPAALPLLVGVLWRSHQQLGTSVAATRELCSWLVKAHQPRTTGGDMVTRRLMLRLMAMTAEITRIKGQRSFLDVTDDMEALAGDLSRAVQEEHLSSSSLSDLLCSLRPPWLTARLASARLHLHYARKRLSGPLTLQLIHTHYLSEKENRMPQTAGAVISGPSVEDGVPVAMPLTPKGEFQAPVGSPAKRRRLGARGTDSGGDGEYHRLLYHLLCAHLLHTGLTEIRVQMTGRLLRDAVTPDQRREAARDPAPPTVCDPADLVTFRRELDWIQDRLWRTGTALQLGSHDQYEQYMRTITKL